MDAAAATGRSIFRSSEDQVSEGGVGKCRSSLGCVLLLPQKAKLIGGCHAGRHPEQPPSTAAAAAAEHLDEKMSLKGKRGSHYFYVREL